MQIRSTYARLGVIFFIGVVLTACARLPATGAGSPRTGVFPDESGFYPRTTSVAGVKIRVPEGSSLSLKKPGPACIAGYWQVRNLAGGMREAYEQAQNGQAFTLDSVEGQVRYHFEPSGTVEISYQELSVTLSGSMDGQPVTVQQALDGSAGADYVVDSSGSSMVVTDFGGEGVQFAFDINGQRLAEGSLPAWRAFAHALSGGLTLTPGPLIRYSRISLTCSEDTLTLQPVEPFPGPQVELSRVEE